jgi:hypothetical protein
MAAPIAAALLKMDGLLGLSGWQVRCTIGHRLQLDAIQCNELLLYNSSNPAAALQAAKSCLLKMHGFSD